MGRVVAGVLAILLLGAAAPAPASGEPLVSVDAGDPVTEGDPDTTEAYFLVSLSEPSADPVVVNLATQDATAIAPGDYTATAEELTFTPGETFAIVAVPVQDDALDESPETFDLKVLSASGATVDAGSATAEIVDDDPEPAVSIADATTSGSSLRFVATLSAPSGRHVYVSTATSDGTARAGYDYASRTSGMSFTAGSTTAETTVRVLNNRALPSGSTPPPPKTLYVDLSNPSYA